MILVTGGTGLIGAHLLLELSLKEDGIRAIYRNKTKIDAVKTFFNKEGAIRRFEKIEWVEADITDIPALQNAFIGIEKVYHCAGLISFDPKDYHLLRKTNIEGTSNMVNLCIAHNVHKLCYLSSIATLGNKIDNKTVDEDVYWNPEAENNVYAITKYGAEMQAWRGTQEGLPTVILNPGVVFGEGFQEAPSSGFFKKVQKGLSFYPPGGTGFVDVKNVVEALVSGMDTPICNERFILVGENATYQDVLLKIALALNKKPPHKKIKPWQLALFWRLDWFLSFFPGRKRKLTRNAAHALLSQTLYSNDKAKKKLNLQFTPLETTIQRIAKKLTF
ncbi:NAD-dependent epimerase/dehydratase family protein [Galbibacter pacificus]|uniref:NAD-dependent epimerase/dehydratase family protein n=1 Tax=Galbibacter pacificus TaxID=2996052 RepID=A0ABT6FSF3_9FLAO|nr:NAD-dependent epimerase/dehydratase family protein [Galbibacter pacificus]MDG3582677.1 NAD-dependent epimerase/dehydratase family protein [Galbibacter pacificus]MDG3586204.1 NAD-dependent epimerase/dehydratase family protein [Galbibacter pacificus]